MEQETDGRNQGEVRTSVLRRGLEDAADVDQIVGDDAQSDKASHAIGSLVAATIDPMAAFEDADAAFTAGAPFLKLLEPTLLLPLFAGGALGVMAGNGYPADPHVLCLGFVGG